MSDVLAREYNVLNRAENRRDIADSTLRMGNVSPVTLQCEES